MEGSKNFAKDLSCISVVYRNEKSYGGFALDVLKSGMQKYIRRGNFEKAVWCAIDLDLFAYALDKSRNEGIRTNLINRLKVIYLEEIGICSPNLLKIINNLVVLLINTRDQRKAGFISFESARQKEEESVVKMVWYLSRAKKLRYMSHLRAAFMKEHYYDQIAKQYPDMHIQNDYNLDKKFLLFIDEKKIEIEDGMTLEFVCNKVVECLHFKDDMAFWWLQKICKKGDEIDKSKKLKKRHGSSKVTFLLFDLVLWGVKKLGWEKKIETMTNIMIQWYKSWTIKEKWMCFAYPMVLVVKRDELDWDEVIDDCNVNYEDLYAINKSGNVIEIDDYVVDWHTKDGKRKGKTLLDFAEEGSKVENEDAKLLNENYKNIYIDMKKWEMGQPYKKKKKI